MVYQKHGVINDAKSSHILYTKVKISSHHYSPNENVLLTNEKKPKNLDRAISIKEKESWFDAIKIRLNYYIMIIPPIWSSYLKIENLLKISGF